MTPSRRLKPVSLAVSACVLVVLVLWLSPGARGIFRGGADGGKGSSDAAAKSHGAGEGDGSAESSTRVRERPPALSKTQRKVRNLLSEQLGVLGPPPRRIDPDRLKEFRAELDRMDPDDLLAVLAELDASDLNASDKGNLAGFIAGSLGRRDPRLALDTFVGRMAGSGAGALDQLGIIYARWAGSDPGAASEWFDQQAAKGALAPVALFGKLQVDPRIYFESQLIRAQAALDPAAADARFAAMPAEVREKILSDEWFRGTSPEKIKAEAEFLRTHYEDGSGTFAKAGSMRIRQGDLGDAEKFLEMLDPAPDERSALVGEALRTRVTGRDELTTTPEEAREWIVKQSPQDASRLTGTMLGQMMQWHEFSEMSRLALQYREESGSDDVLVAFLKSAPDKSKVEILQLAEQISDPAVRQEVIGRFGK
jgi:hypothetical protein